MRREFSRSVKFEIIQRATRDGVLYCESCGMNVTGKKAEIDHKLAEALVVDKTKPLTAADGWLIGLKCCHRAKSAADIKIIRKSDRQRAKHIGAKQPSRFPKPPPGTRWDWKLGRRVFDKETA